MGWSGGSGMAAEAAYLDAAEKMTDAERVELDRRLGAWLDSK